MLCARKSRFFCSLFSHSLFQTTTIVEENPLGYFLGPEFCHFLAVGQELASSINHPLCYLEVPFISVPWFCCIPRPEWGQRCVGVISISFAGPELACLGIACIGNMHCVITACLETEFDFNERLESHKGGVSWMAMTIAGRVASYPTVGRCQPFIATYQIKFCKLCLVTVVYFLK